MQRRGGVNHKDAYITVGRHADIRRPVTGKPFKFRLGTANHTPGLERIKADGVAFVCLSGPAAFCSATLRKEGEDQRQENR